MALPIIAYSQEINKTITEPFNNEEILIGHCNISAFSKVPFESWYNQEHKKYKPDALITDQLKSLDLSGITFVIIIGTWCDDSQKEFPRFIKILNELEFNMQQINIICVNTHKEAETTNVFKMDIEYVPTFIIKKEGIEIGRIIESPKNSLESDLLKILTL